ncbi:hypothetical protein [Aliiglaciecola sp. LCG003]|uniref:glycine zipper 2TM domain-containing protein n=1 Tax=Aliiglaciecola sp. LCG003 TaxID=3053655 RepID=UPI002572EFC5|nr:hypothetical protein [Aliiglaciecola sp. LCG003]WJG10840.1 hypothetical protein QR722_07370 [Aliiglaciecola sp. LCG003]
MHKLKLISFAVIALGLSTGSAIAQSYYDYAKVVKAKPVYHYVYVSQPQQQCYPIERRSRHANRHSGHRTGSTLTGAVIGGAIGNIIGDNRASTVAGALVGGIIGSSGYHDHHNSQIVERCETVYQSNKKVRKIKGYDVKYRYHGEAYETFMQHHPGDKIKVRVRVPPLG